MSASDNYIIMMQTLLPNECSPKDLVKAGLYRTRGGLCWAMKHGHSPSYFKLGGRIMFTKEAVIEWLKMRKHDPVSIVDFKGEKTTSICSEAEVA